MTSSETAQPKRILVTGANRGLGYELVRLLIERGHHVWGSAREEAPEQLLGLGPAGVLRFDLGDEASIGSAIADLGTQVQGLDLLVNCAGADARTFGAPADTRGPFDFDAHTFTEVSRINATGPMVVTRDALPLLRSGTDSMVLNISSQLGSMEVAATKGRDTAYCVSKAALNMWSLKAAHALRAENIGVVMMHPGWVQTDLGGSEAPMTPIESATAIVDTISNLAFADSGRFIKWDGSDHPW